MPPPPNFRREDHLTPEEVAALWRVTPEAVRRLLRINRDDPTRGVPGVQIAERVGPHAPLRWYVRREIAEQYATERKS